MYTFYTLSEHSLKATPPTMLGTFLHVWTTSHEYVSQVPFILKSYIKLYTYISYTFVCYILQF